MDGGSQSDGQPWDPGWVERKAGQEGSGGWEKRELTKELDVYNQLKLA